MKFCVLFLIIASLGACQEPPPYRYDPQKNYASSADAEGEVCTDTNLYRIHRGASITWRVQKLTGEADESTLTGTTGVTGLLSFVDNSWKGAKADLSLTAQTTESGNSLRDSRIEDYVFGGSAFRFELSEISSSELKREVGESKIVTVKGTLHVAGQSTKVEMPALVNETSEMITITPAEIFALNIRALEPSSNGLNLVDNLSRLLKLVPGVEIKDEVSIDFSLELFPSCEKTPEIEREIEIIPTEPKPEVPPPELSDLPDLTPDDRPPTVEERELALGQTTFGTRCASCHVYGPDLYRKMAATDILDHYAKNFPTHRSVQWPNEEEAYAIEKALR